MEHINKIQQAELRTRCALPFSLWQSMLGAFVASVAFVGGLGSPGAPEEEAKIPEAPKEPAQWLVGVPSFPRTSQNTPEHSNSKNPQRHLKT
jgi:hypothetical protein